MFNKKHKFEYFIEAIKSVPDVGGKDYYGYHTIVGFLDSIEIGKNIFNAYDYICESTEDEECNKELDDNKVIFVKFGMLLNRYGNNELDIICTSRNVQFGNGRDLDYLFKLDELRKISKALKAMKCNDEELNNRLEFTISGVTSAIEYQTSKAIASLSEICKK